MGRMDTDWDATLEQRWRALTDGERLRLMAMCCRHCGAITNHSEPCRASGAAGPRRSWTSDAVRVAMGRLVTAVGWTSNSLRIGLSGDADGRRAALVVYGVECNEDSLPVGFVGSRLIHIDDLPGRPGGRALAVVTSVGEWVIPASGEVGAGLEVGH